MKFNILISLINYVLIKPVIAPLVCCLPVAELVFKLKP